MGKGKGTSVGTGSNKATDLGRVVDDVVGDSSGGLLVNGDLGNVVHLVVDLGSDLSDDGGGHNMLLDGMNRDDSGGSVVGDSGGSVVGDSGGSVDSDSRGSGVGDSGGSSNNRGSSDSGGSGIDSWGSGNSSSSVDTSMVDSTGTNETPIAGTNETAIAGTNETAIAGTEETSVSSNELSISISSGGSDGHSHEGRQSNKGLHIDLC